MQSEKNGEPVQVVEQTDELPLTNEAPNPDRTRYLDEIDPDVLASILNDIKNEEENVLDIPSLNTDLSLIKKQLVVNKIPLKSFGVRIFYGSAPKVKTSKAFKPPGNVKATCSDPVKSMITGKKHVLTA
ncbi:hypothetical protein RYX36_013728 [Vicia faba]